MLATKIAHLSNKIYCQLHNITSLFHGRRIIQGSWEWAYFHANTLPVSKAWNHGHFCIKWGMLELVNKIFEPSWYIKVTGSELHSNTQMVWKDVLVLSFFVSPHFVGCFSRGNTQNIFEFPRLDTTKETHIIKWIEVYFSYVDFKDLSRQCYF